MSLLVVLLLSLAVPGQATTRKPDFTGRWTALSPGYEGREIRIAEVKGTLRVTNALERTPQSVTYNLDGSPRREAAGPGEERWATLSWKNSNTLVLLDTRMTRTAEVRTEHTLSFDTSRRLILGIARTELAGGRDASAAAPSPQRKTVIVLRKNPARGSPRRLP